METTTRRPHTRQTPHRVSLITHGGHHITDTLLAYDATDAAQKARNMIRANHGESYSRVLAVTAA